MAPIVLPNRAIISMRAQFLKEKSPPRQALSGFVPMCAMILLDTGSKISLLFSSPRPLPASIGITSRDIGASLENQSPLQVSRMPVAVQMKAAARMRVLAETRGVKRLRKLSVMLGLEPAESRAMGG